MGVLRVVARGRVFRWEPWWACRAVCCVGRRRVLGIQMAESACLESLENTAVVGSKELLVAVAKAEFESQISEWVLLCSVASFGTSMVAASSEARRRYRTKRGKVDDSQLA